jgi:hypothetical protein
MSCCIGSMSREIVMLPLKRLPKKIKTTRNLTTAIRTISSAIG